MNSPSRRRFLAATGTAAAAMGAATILPVAPAHAAAGEQELSGLESPLGDPLASDQLVVWVNSRAGELTVLTDETEITVTDRALVDRITHIARNGATNVLTS